MNLFFRNLYRPKVGELYNVTNYAYMTVRPYYHFEVPTIEKAEPEVKYITKYYTKKESKMMRVVELDCDKLGIDFGDRINRVDNDKAREAEWTTKLVDAKQAEREEKLSESS